MVEHQLHESDVWGDAQHGIRPGNWRQELGLWLLISKSGFRRLYMLGSGSASNAWWCMRSPFPTASYNSGDRVFVASMQASHIPERWGEAGSHYDSTSYFVAFGIS